MKRSWTTSTNKKVVLIEVVLWILMLNQWALQVILNINDKWGCGTHKHIPSYHHPAKSWTHVEGKLPPRYDVTSCNIDFLV